MNNAVYKNIISRFKGVFLRYVLVSIAEALGYSFALLSGLMSISTLLESVLYLTPAVKTYLFFSSLIIPVLFFVSLLSLIIIRRPDHNEISRMIENTYPHLNNRLISAIQLGRLKDNELKGQSKELIDALLEKVDDETASLNFSRAVPTGRLILSLKIASGTIFLVLLTAILFPFGIMGGFYRLADYSRPYIPPGKTTIYTVHRESSIIRGENFKASGFIAGDKSNALIVVYRWEDSETWNVKPVSVDDVTGDFNVTIEKPRISFQYYLETNNVVTSKYSARVIERPDVETLEITLTYPEYTGIGTVSRKDNDGNIRALKGTDVSLILSASKTLKEMSIFWSDSTVTHCRVNGNTAAVSFKVTKSVDYHFGLIDTLDIPNINPITYRLTCFQDEIPSVSILSPVADITLRGSMRFPLIYRASDDYGLSSVSLKFKLPYEDEFRTISLQRFSLPQDNPGKDFEGEYLWNMSGLNLLPGDVVPFNIIVYDNDIIGGPKQGISETRNARFPSMTDILKELVEEQNTGINKLRKITDRAVEQEMKLDDVSRNIKSNKELEWSDKNALEEAKKYMENMQKEVRDISENIKNVAEKLSDENVIAVETLEKLQKISDIMEDIADGEMKEALQRLTQANIEIDPRKVKQNLDRYKITAENIKSKLDRIINLLEQVMSIQRYEMARSLLEDMAVKQAEMSQKYMLDPENSAYPREEEKLAVEMEKIQDELRGVAQDLKNNFRLNTERFEQSIEFYNVAEIKKQSSQQMSDGLIEKAERSLNTSNAMISELLKEIDALGAIMQATNSEEMKRRLFKSLNEMLVISDKQEKLLKEIKSSDNEKLATRQLDIIDALSKAEKSLLQFSEIFFELSGIVDQMMTATSMIMENTVDQFAAGNIGSGEKNARDALKTLNNSIHFLTMLIQKSESSYDGMSMPGDLMQQLQNIANGQLSLNEQLGSELMEKLAAEQQKLAEMLSELSEKIMEDKSLREMLEKLAEEMDDTGSLMRRNEKRELIERKQLDIYRRLLDARRSRRKKDESEERKSITARRNISIGSEKLAGDLGEKELDLNKRIREAMNDDFDPEYMRLIRSYFESLLQYKLEVE